MKMFLIICLLFGGNFNFVHSTFTVGPIGPILFHLFAECNPPINTIGLNVGLETQSDKSKSVSMKMKTLQDFGDELEMYVVADKWENNEWMKEAFKKSGYIFEFVNEYLPKVWSHVREQMKPKLQDSNMIPAGDYELASFQENYENIEIPQVMYGRFNITSLISVNGKDILCFLLELETLKP